ncbi:MAG: DUF4861 family protein [Opitutaceae bacterium]
MKTDFKRFFFSLSVFAALTASAVEPSTHCRHVPERADDFAWENDKIAFRAYGPELKAKGEDSGFDAWLKRVDYPIVDKWYAENASGKSYHKDHGEGYDPYKVGSSRGCGGLALWIDGEMVASNVYTKWEILKSEPAESVFILHYEWEHAGDRYTEAKQISIKLGERLFKSTSTFTKNGKAAAELPIAVGLVRHHTTDIVEHDLEAGWFATWETLDKSALGTGVVIDPDLINSFIIQQSGRKLADHALVIVKTDAKGQLEYHAGYGWERAGEITSIEQWVDYLGHFSKTL